MKPRSKLVVLNFALATLVGVAHGEWIFTGPADLMPTTDLIVVGELGGHGREVRGDREYERAQIEVRDVLYGDAVPGQRLTLRWDNPVGLVCPRVDHSPHLGQAVIWLLRREGETVRADHPQRAVPIGTVTSLQTELETHRRALAEVGPEPKLEAVVDYLRARLAEG